MPLYKVSTVYVDINKPIKSRHDTEYIEADSEQSIKFFYSYFSNVHLKKISLVLFVNNSSLFVNNLGVDIDYTSIGKTQYIYEIFCNLKDGTVKFLPYLSDIHYILPDDELKLLEKLKIKFTDIEDIISVVEV